MVLDSEGLSKVVLEDRTVLALIRSAQARDARVLVSILTLVEAHHARVDAAGFDRAVSRMIVEPVSEVRKPGPRGQGLTVRPSDRQSARSATAVTLAMRIRTRSSPGTPLRAPYSSARSWPT